MNSPRQRNESNSQLNENMRPSNIRTRNDSDTIGLQDQEEEKDSQNQQPRLQRGRSFKVHQDQQQQFHSNIIINQTSQNLLWMPPFQNAQNSSQHNQAFDVSQQQQVEYLLMMQKQIQQYLEQMNHSQSTNQNSDTSQQRNPQKPSTKTEKAQNQKKSEEQKMSQHPSHTFAPNLLSKDAVIQEQNSQDAAIEQLDNSQLRQLLVLQQLQFQNYIESLNQTQQQIINEQTQQINRDPTAHHDPNLGVSTFRHAYGEMSEFEDQTGYFSYLPLVHNPSLGQSIPTEPSPINQPLLFKDMYSQQQRRQRMPQSFGLSGAANRVHSFFKVLKPWQRMTDKVKPFVDQNKRRIKNMKIKLYKQFQREQEKEHHQSQGSNNEHKATFGSKGSGDRDSANNKNDKARSLRQMKQYQTDQENNDADFEFDQRLSSQKKRLLKAGASCNPNRFQDDVEMVDRRKGDGLSSLNIQEGKYFLGKLQDGEVNKVQKQNNGSQFLERSVIEGEDGEDDMFAFDDQQNNSRLQLKSDYISQPQGEVQLKRLGLYIDDEDYARRQKGVDSTYSEISISLESNEQETKDYTRELGDLNLKTIKYRRLKKKRCNPIFPDSNFKTGWDFIGLFLIMYEAIIIPYRVAFNIPSSGLFASFEFCVDLFFLTDVFINMYTGYYKKGFLVMKRRHIICRYLKTWFILDFMSSFPYAWFIEIVNDVDLNELEQEQAQEDWDNFKKRTFTHPQGSLIPTTAQLLRLLKIIRFVRIIRLIRLFKLRRLVYRFEEIFFNDKISTLMEVIKVFIVLFFLVHWTGCIFFFIGDIERRNEIQPNWIQQLNFDQIEQPIDLYVITASWALTTMTTVGYGDVYPASPIEMIFTTFCMIIACGFFAYLVGSIFAIIDRTTTLIADFQEKMLQINDFMIHNHIPRDFRTKIRMYLTYLLDNKKEFKLEDEDVLDMLNENLRLEMIMHLNGKMLQSTTLFKSFDIAFVSELTFVLKRETFTIDENIFVEGEQGDSLYYLCSGNVSIIHKKTLSFIKNLGAEDFMGECAFFSQGLRKATARSKTFTQVIKLMRKDFLEQAEPFAKAVKSFENIQQEINQFNDYRSIGLVCYVCEKVGHISTDCKDFSKIQGSLKLLAKQKSNKEFDKKSSSVNRSADEIKVFKSVSRANKSAGHRLIEAKKLGSIKFNEDYFDEELKRSIYFGTAGQKQDFVEGNDLLSSKSYLKLPQALSTVGAGGNDLRNSLSGRGHLSDQSFLRISQALDGSAESSEDRQLIKKRQLSKQEQEEQDFFKRILRETENEKYLIGSKMFQPRASYNPFQNQKVIEEIKEQSGEDESFRSSADFINLKNKRKQQPWNSNSFSRKQFGRQRQEQDSSPKEAQTRAKSKQKKYGYKKPKYSVTSFKEFLEKDDIPSASGTWNMKTMSKEQLELISQLNPNTRMSATEMHFTPPDISNKRLTSMRGKQQYQPRRNNERAQLTRYSHEDQAFLIRKFDSQERSQRRHEANREVVSISSESRPSLMQAETQIGTRKSYIKRKRGDKLGISQKFFEGINIEKKSGGNFKDLLENSIKRY